MLSKKQTQLLTALVDGELSSRQRKTAIRLLKKSPEARDLFKKLRHDANRLRSLPRTQLPRDFSTKVMREIIRLDRPAPAARPVPAPEPQPAPFPTWLGLAMAACLLFMVMMGSYFYFSGINRNREPQTNMAKGPDAKNQKQPKQKPVLKPMLHFTLADLQQDGARERLQNELQKDSAFQMEVNCQNGAKVVSRLQHLLKGPDIDLVMEPAVEDSLKKSRGRKYILYMENISPVEVSTLLYDLAKGEKEIPSTVKEVALFALSSEQRGRVAGLLGVSPEKLQPPAQAGKKDLDLRDKVPFLPKDGNGKTDGAISPTPPAPEMNPPRLAVLLPLDADGNAASSSQQIQRFLKERRPPRPGTLQVVFVLNEVA